MKVLQEARPEKVSTLSEFELPHDFQFAVVQIVLQGYYYPGQKNNHAADA